MNTNSRKVLTAVHAALGDALSTTTQPNPILDVPAEPTSPPEEVVATPITPITPTVVLPPSRPQMPEKETDGRVWFVDPDKGDDHALGDNPDRPFRTPDRAKAALRSGYPDQVLFREGTTLRADGLGYWNKSGAGAGEEMVLGTYGDVSKPLHVIVDPKEGSRGLLTAKGENVSHVRFEGFRFTQAERDSSSKVYNPERCKDFSVGIVMRFTGTNVRFQDVRVDHFAQGADFSAVNAEEEAFMRASAMNNTQKDAHKRQVQNEGKHHIKDMVFEDCDFFDNFTHGGAHSQGMFLSGIQSTLFDRCFFDQNGHLLDDPLAEANEHRHNLYQYFTLNSTATARDCLFTRGSSHGFQFRGGAHINNCFMGSNALHVLIDGASSMVSSAIMDTGDIIGRRETGEALEVSSTESFECRDNLIAFKQSTTNHGRALNIRQKSRGSEEYPDPWRDWIGNETMLANIQNNVIHDWYNGGPFSPFMWSPSEVSMTESGNRINDPADTPITVGEALVAANLVKQGTDFSDYRTTYEVIGDIGRSRGRGVRNELASKLLNPLLTSVGL